MRRATTTAILTAVLLSPLGALAEPTTRPGAKAPANDEPAPEPEAAPPASAPAPPPAPNLAVPAATLDLTPSRLFGPLGSLGARKSEERPAITLGDDRDWKVQAVQIGAMVGAFGALTALCAGGRCAQAFGDVLPGFLQSKEGSTAELGGGAPRPRSAD
jgi:hypothetical protein